MSSQNIKGTSQDYFDEWEYFQDPDSGIGIVVNHFRDECIGSSGELLKGVPQLNLYVVPKDKVANNDWHNDMEILEMSDAYAVLGYRR